MDLFLPWTLAQMIDVVIPEGRKGEILLWGFFMVVCSVLAVTLSVVANRMASRVASDVTYELRRDLFAKVLYLSNSQVDEFTMPSLISRLTSDTYYVHQFLARVQRLGVRAPILLIGGIIMTLLLDPALALVLLATLPLLTAIVVLVSKKSIPMYLKVQESADEFVRLVREDIAGIRVIKALSKESFEERRFETVNKTLVDREKKATMVTSISNPALNICLNLGLVGVILVGAWRVDAGMTEVGKILAFMSYFTIILNALMSISRIFIMVSKGSASARRIERILDAQDERELELEDKQCIKGAHIVFDRVGFSYTKGAEHLSDISFALQKGETLGIIGATGSGKSTIVNLLMRFYDVSRGTIYLDGQNIASMELKELRQRFGTVFQNDVIFGESIYENLDMGRHLDEEEARKALEYARAAEFVAEKGGLEEKLSIRGANLSGGQKQRILIARALAKKPEILILDDSCSALDYKTDAALRKELREHFPETTCIIVAQRISSVMNADHILVLEDGKMIGYGTHEELMSVCEVYREIGSSQLGI